MEGPSLIILREEADKFVGQRVVTCTTTLAKVDCSAVQGKKIRELSSWGKHFLMTFEPVVLKVHFLMFGSYWIDSVRPEKVPRLTLTFKNGFFHFYSCSVQPLAEPPEEIYDWRVDVMSDQWDENYVLRMLKKQPEEMVCDVVLDQCLFAGAGNIIKNEVLFNLGLLPEVKVGELTARQQRALVREVRKYSQQFYVWKKAFVLRKNWHVYRRRICAVCGSAVEMNKTGKLNRVSFWCPQCQPALTWEY